MNQLRDDEIDVYEILLTLWNGKWIVTLCMIVFLLLGGLILIKQETTYESRINYKIDNFPPFYDEEKGRRDFQFMFYSENYFNSWKEENKDSLIKFDDFTQTKDLDGIFITKDINNRLATLVTEKTKENDILTHILVKTNQLNLLNDFFNYSNFVNNELSKKYIGRATEELEVIKKESLVSQNDFTRLILEIDRYIEAAIDGGNVLLINHPTEPIVTSKKSRTILVNYLAIGCIIGIFLVFILKIFRKKK